MPAPARHPTLDGKGRQKCCRLECGRWSLRGHVKGQGLCPYHWAVYAYGAWHAKDLHPKYRPAPKGGQ